MRAILGVDLIQVPLVGLFTPAFLVLTAPDIFHLESLGARLRAATRYDGETVAAVAVAALNAAIGQLFSLLNFGAVSNIRDLRGQRRLLMSVGLGTALVLSAFVLAGIFAPSTSRSAWQQFADAYSQISQRNDASAIFLSAILILGMTCVLLTTADAIVVTAIMFWYDDIWGADSFSEREGPRELWKIRGIGIAVFAGSFAVLMLLNYWQPDPFYFLLSAAGGVIVFGPMIVAAILVCARTGAARAFTPGIVYAFFTLFVISGATNMILLLVRSPFVAYSGVVAVGASSLTAVVVVVKARRTGGTDEGSRRRAI